jgi:hypothetical protein
MKSGSEVMPLNVMLATVTFNPVALTFPKMSYVQTSEVDVKLAPVNMEP